jgi:hypothetical protein
MRLPRRGTIILLMFNSPLMRVLTAVVVLLPMTWDLAERRDQQVLIGKARALAPGSEPAAAREAFEHRARFFASTASLRAWLARLGPDYDTAGLHEPAAWVTVASSDLVILLRYDGGRLAAWAETWRGRQRRETGVTPTAAQPRPFGPAGS